MKKQALFLALLLCGSVSLAFAAAPVAGVAAVATSADSVTVSWLPRAGASRYSVHQALSASGPFHQVATVGAATSHRQTGLASATTYYFKVLAEADGDAALAAEAAVVSATTAFGDSIAPDRTSHPPCRRHRRRADDQRLQHPHHAIPEPRHQDGAHPQPHPPSPAKQRYNLSLSFSNPDADSERRAAAKEAARSDTAYASFNLGDLGVGSSWSGRGGQEIPVTVLKRWSFWSEGSVYNGSGI